MSEYTRRQFVRTGAAIGMAAMSPGALAAFARRNGDDTLRIGVIGCGGRGTGAAVNALEADEGTRIVAMADLFEDRLNGSLGHLSGIEQFKGRVDVSPDRRYTGFDAYKRLLLDGGIDYVILATPPHFRPMMFEAAVDAGVHVFMEKPVAVDPAGVRTVIEAASHADAQRLCVVAGTQRRHQECYLQAMQRIRDGAIGEIVSASCSWNQGGLWVHKRKPEYSDMEWQIRNWLYFCWLSGDHIVEQHVHNLDAVNWAMGGPPIRCTGMGGRQVRTAPEYGNIFDHFAVEYEYANGANCLSTCRQIDGCDSRVEEIFRGTKGQARTHHGFAEIAGQQNWRYDGSNPNPYVVEHQDLIRAIRSGERLNEARRVAESTLTAIMGRMSAYTGKSVTWEQAMSSKLDLSPSAYVFGDLPVREVPVPGRTPLI